MVLISRCNSRGHFICKVFTEEIGVAPLLLGQDILPLKEMHNSLKESVTVVMVEVLPNASAYFHVKLSSLYLEQV